MKICGIDEAGRGALAGELAIGACILKNNSLDEILDDSKKISEKKREEIFEEITKNSSYLVLFFNNKIIDEIGLSECFTRALKTIKNHFGTCEFIFDGNCNYKVEGIKTLIKADSKVKAVSAASILAKVSRDRQMRIFDTIYPDFGYAKHKGYGTKAHIDAISKFGENELTRKSFKLKKK